MENWDKIVEFLATKPDEEIDAVRNKMKEKYPAGEGGELA